MAHQIIKQPDGKYLVYSTVEERVVLRDCTEEELVQEYLKVEEEKLRSSIHKIVDKIESDGKPYYQFSLSYEEAIERDKLRASH